MKQALLIAIFRNRPLHELHGGWCERGRSLDLPYSIMNGAVFKIARRGEKW